MSAAERITTPFTADSTAAEVLDGVDLTGRRAVVTGATSGIGVEIARAFAAAGAEVTLAARDPDTGEATAEDIRATTGNPRIAVARLNLSDQGSVAAFTAGWQGPLHILVNNAGIVCTPELRTREGWELQFATNHLGHFALATGLHPVLAATSGARVVTVSSAAHLSGGVDFEDVHFRHRPYDPALAYAQSKTANVLFAVEANRRWASEDITVNAAHPGAIRTRLTRHLSRDEAERAAAGGEFPFRTPEQGAATPVLVATWPPLAGRGGRYFEDCNEAAPHEPGAHSGVAAHALDQQAAARLWRLSLEMLAAARHA
ncbi:SDR family NAD(P)-dependent oxidoreductase [Streptomyces hoynatensis]|uniref:Probable oxidoreductase n=1 Tax=Streptomyces hoynatensis TaxID=1141874 RepID=A0A3A9YQ79_9ACTN|nr:SDR family NAD(P)-dependent oxidoreductase [Streptomyces hoynatensis]RKN38271.1 SDR family NAD(P)-dependent oxidoreductase [Streptomyces hoynatensis]